MRSQDTFAARGPHPYRRAGSWPDASDWLPSRDRALTLARLFVLGWSCLRLLFSDGNGLELERILAVLIALGAAVSLSNEESFR